MGDSGSMLLGLVLSGSALTLTGQFASVQMTSGAGGAQASLLPDAAADPAADLDPDRALRRPGARGDPSYPSGRSPFSPDKEHLHHRLLEIGHCHRRAVLIIWMWAALIAFGAVLASLYAGRVTTVALLAWVALTVLLTFVLPRVQRHGTPG